MNSDSRTIHIDHVFHSYYAERWLIIYRVYGKRRQWWHEFMCTDTEMDFYIETAKKLDQIKK